jgi:hypothetical protein
MTYRHLPLHPRGES